MNPIRIALLAVALLPALAFSPQARAQVAGAVQIEACDSGTLLLRRDGTVWAFGRNNEGQLGDGTNFLRSTPVRIQGLPGIRKIAARGTTGYALAVDGTVWAWGRNGNGQVGDGTTTNRLMPVRVAGLADMVHIAAGSGHALAIRRDGTLWAWGLNTAGQLGDATLKDRSTPVQVPGIFGAVDASAGSVHSLAVLADGTVWTWGGNLTGQLGDGTFLPKSSPVQVTGLPIAARSGAVGDSHTLVVLANGSVYGWGWNAYYQLADAQPATVTSISRPAIIPGLQSIQRVIPGPYSSMALTNDNRLLAWGVNGEGQLGVSGSSALTLARPTLVTRYSSVLSAHVGRTHGVAITSDGAVWASGYNDLGQLGDGTLMSSREPVRIAGPGGLGLFDAFATNFPSNRLPDLQMESTPARGTAPQLVTVSAEGSIDPDGSIMSYTWTTFDGRSATGPSASFVYDRPGVHRIVLRAVDNAGGVSHTLRQFIVENPVNLARTNARPKVAVGNGFASLGLRDDGTVRAWGNNFYFGNPVAVRSAIPYPVLTENLTGVVSVATRSTNSFAVRADGTVWGWGLNAIGQLGDGSAVIRTTPVPIPNLTDIREVSASSTFVLARRGDGTVYSWGSNALGALGDGSTTDRKTPQQILGLADIVAISAGSNHAVALRSDGVVLSWGFSFHGDGTPFRIVRTPTPVTAVTGFVAIAAGTSVTLAVRADGTVWRWGGANTATGEVGHTVPVQLSGLDSIVAVSSASGSHLALRSDGTLWAWGGNSLGELGDGTTLPRAAPRPIEGLKRITSIDIDRTVVATNAEGQVFGWGANFFGNVGDGTLATRTRPQIVLGEGGTGILDLVPATLNAVPEDKIVAFPVVATGAVSDAGAGDVVAELKFRPEDVGSTGGIYVFALAPADIVRPVAGEEPFVVGKTISSSGAKADAVPCVLAQLTSTGQLQQVSATSIQAFVTGVLGAQGAAVSVINGVSSVIIGGATFYLGYGPNPAQMLNGGLNRSVVSIPGPRECRPQAPQKGWWWNPAEGGRGFSIETSGNRIFTASFLYDASGRSTWYVAAGPTSLDGSIFSSRLLSVANGQTLSGDYRRPGPIVDAGAFTLAFSDDSNGTLVWPGGVVPIERFNIVPDGLAAAPQANVPESGWWWNAAEDGRGFFIEWQNGTADVAGYMYDDAGQPVWYLSVYPTPNARVFSGNWWTYANGQTITGAYRPATRTSDNFAPLRIDFQSPTDAILTLPTGRRLPITRFRF